MYRIGVDLGGTNIAVGVVNEKFEIIASESLPTEVEQGNVAIIDKIAALCKSVTQKAGLTVADIEAVGIASPGICDHDNGVVVYANNLPFKNFRICEMLKERFPVAKCFVENDANAAAWGEAIAGAAKGHASSVMITLGTGVGGGIIIDHKVYSGFNYAGAELGHIVIEHNGYPCSCGRRGCWESYSSATALIRMTREKLEECEKAGRATVMTELVAKDGKVSGRTAFNAKKMGDQAADEVVEMYVDYLACGLASIINIFQPEIISIGGGISNEGDYLLNMLVSKVRSEQYGGGLVPLTEIVIAKLKNDAGIVGSAVLGM